MCSAYLGINPNDYQNSIKLVQRYRLFETPLQSRLLPSSSNARLSHIPDTPVYADIAEGIQPTYKESYRTFELWGSYFLNPRLQLNFMLPYTDNRLYENEREIQRIEGLGDVIAMGKYQLYNTKQGLDTTLLKQRVIVGGGFKLPTGAFEEEYVTGRIDPHLQSGTGSLDYLALFEYLMQFRKVGLNLNFIYRMNGKNKNDFRFANRYNNNMTFFVMIKGRLLTFMPMIGYAYESSERDENRGEKHLGSGGQALFVTSGMKVFYKKFAISATYFAKPIQEDLYDQPLQLNNEHRFITNLTWFF